MLLFLSIMSITCVSCSGDDDDDNPQITSSIIGNWRTTYYTSSVGGDLTFNSNGKYVMQLTTKSGTSKYNGSFEVSSGTYEGVIKLYDEKGGVRDFWDFKLSSYGHENEMYNEGVSLKTMKSV